MTTNTIKNQETWSGAFTISMLSRTGLVFILSSLTLYNRGKRMNPYLIFQKTGLKQRLERWITYKQSLRHLLACFSNLRWKRY